MRKTVVVYLSLSLFGLLASLILVEVGLRILHFLGEQSWLGLTPLRTTITWQEHPIIGQVLLTPNSQGFVVTPSREYYNFVSSNNEGFYDENHQIEKPSQTYRLILLGDSFVASLQTPPDQTLARKLEGKFNKLGTGKQIEVIALGLGDTGTAQQLLALQEIGLKYQPDLVIQMFLTANDLKNNSPALEQDPFRPYFKLNQQGDLELISHQRKTDQSAANLKKLLKQSRVVELALFLRQLNLENQVLKLVDYPLDYHVYDQDYLPEYREAWLVTERLLLETKRLVEDNQAKYLLVTLASNEQVNPSVWTQLKATYPKLATANIDLNKPDKLVGQFCDKDQVKCLELVPEFAKSFSQNPGKLTHYPKDGHWTSVGTDIAVDSLVKYLKENADYFFSK